MEYPGAMSLDGISAAEDQDVGFFFMVSFLQSSYTACHPRRYSVVSNSITYSQP